MASTALRAALETEKEADDPRFDEYRSGDCVIAMHPDLKSYAIRLGQVADKLADEDPLPATSRALDRLRSISFPLLSIELPEFSDNRLLELACVASDHAVLSSKLEIYPRGLSAERALALAQNVLACPPGASLTADEIRTRVAARYPDSQPLPDRPELDRLIESLSSELRWNDQAVGGKGGYESTYRETATYQTSKPFPTRVSFPGVSALQGKRSPEASGLGTCLGPSAERGRHRRRRRRGRAEHH